MGPEVESASASDADDPRAALLGEALHRVLEWATQAQAEGDRAAWCAAATQMYALDVHQAASLMKSVDAVLDSPATQPFLGAQPLLWAGNEVAVMHEGQELRLDRLVLRPPCNDFPATWWILDYKLNPKPLAEPAYIEQMRRYCQAVQAMQPNAKVCGAFISADGMLHLSD
jgi:ATP-dependent helicase/nuclease subunit A